MQSMITNRQKGVIHQQAAMLGLDDETYRKRLNSMFGVGSCKELSAVQATELIYSFERDGAVLNTKFRDWRRKERQTKGPRTGTRKKQGNVTGLVTGKQRWLMDLLCDLMEWKVADGFSRWIQKQYGIERVKTDKQAHAVISGLQGMLDQQMRAKEGPDWRGKVYESAKMMKYLKYYGKRGGQESGQRGQGGRSGQGEISG